jgi:tetratricopeptide (TPR) repeat protein
MAMVALESINSGIPEATQHELSSTTTTNTNSAKLLETAYKTEVLSVQGRVLLQAGAVAEASQIFQEAQTEWEQSRKEAGVDTDVESHVVVQHTPAQLLTNEGLLCFAYANYEQAIECFKNATDTLRDSSLTPVYRSEDWVGPSVVGVAPHATLFNECINNMAICALYTCRMPEAVNLMESLVREDPTAFLTERVAFNLCTMYELGCDSTASARKKRVLQLVAKRFFLHDVGPESFRIN